LNDNESEEEQSYKFEINKKRINNVINKKLFSLRVNKDKTLGDENSSNFTKDNENVKNINRGTLIKQFSNNIESTIDLLNEENNENITIKISNLLQNLCECNKCQDFIILRRYVDLNFLAQYDITFDKYNEE
jgi:hypothetical protein